MELLTLFFQINVCLALFAFTYQILLRRLTFYTYNRLYLLATVVLSIVIPLSEVEVVRQRRTNIDQVFEIGEKAAVRPTTTGTADLSHEFATDYTFVDWEPIFTGTYLLITLILLVRLIWLVSIILKYSKGSVVLDGFRIVNPNKRFRNCSFFNLLFIDIDQSSASNTKMIVTHEREHALRLHSADKLLMEVIHSFLWASPLIYYYRTVMAEVHEFEVDQAAAASCKKEDYASFLLALTVPTAATIANGVNSGSLRERVRMLFSEPSHKMKKNLYFFTLPLIAGLTWLFTVKLVYAAVPAGHRVTGSHFEIKATVNGGGNYYVSEDPTTTWNGTAAGQGEARKIIETPKIIPVQANGTKVTDGPITILLDPGHGGKDPGGEGLATKEKEIVLRAAVRLKELLETMGAVVLLTRETDEFVSLRDRVLMASNRADVFISLHMQMATAEKDLRGLQIFYSADQKNEKVRSASYRLANSLHSGLASNQELIVRENLKVPLMVLRAPEIPAVLLQLGFLTDRHDLSAISQTDQLQFIANVIYRSASEVSTLK